MNKRLKETLNNWLIDFKYLQKLAVNVPDCPEDTEELTSARDSLGEQYYSSQLFHCTRDLRDDLIAAKETDPEILGMAAAIRTFVTGLVPESHEDCLFAIDELARTGRCSEIVGFIEILCRGVAGGDKDAPSDGVPKAGSAEREETALPSDGDGVGINTECFSVCDKTLTGFDTLAGITSVVIPEELGIHNIGANAFEGAEITEIVIPKGISYIGPYAFSNCTKLQKLQLPSTLKAISEYAFYNCRSLEKLRIPGSVKDIGQEAFKHCSCLKTLVLPSELTYIEKGCFEMCTSLEKVVWPKALRFVGARAFMGCGSLKKMVLPEPTTYVGSRAFDGCKNLESFTLLADPRHVKFTSDCFGTPKTEALDKAKREFLLTGGCITEQIYDDTGSDDSTKSASWVYDLAKQILDTVAAFYSVPVEEICGRKNSPKLRRVRYVAAHCLHKDTTLRPEEIGQMLGGRDKSIVLTADKTIENAEEGFKDEVQRLQVRIYYECDLYRYEKD